MGFLNMGVRALGYPAGAFAHPDEVVRNPDLTPNEKRAILASWASDACAVEGAPALRRVPDGRLAPFDDIMDALLLLACESEQIREAPDYRHAPECRRGLSKRMFGVASRGRHCSSVN